MDLTPEERKLVEEIIHDFENGDYVEMGAQHNIQGETQAEQFVRLTKQIQRDQGIEWLDAVRVARVQYPSLYDAFMADGQPEKHKASPNPYQFAERDEYDRIWKAIKAQERCSTQEAMRRAQARHPDVYQRFLDNCPIVEKGVGRG